MMTDLHRKIYEISCPFVFQDNNQKQSGKEAIVPFMHNEPCSSFVGICNFGSYRPHSETQENESLNIDEDTEVTE